MDNEQIAKMDPFILLSITNMKLRDNYSSLDILCDDLDIDKKILLGRLGAAGYSYNQSNNQFTSE